MADASVSVGADASAFNKTLKGMQAALSEGCTSMTARLARLGQALNAMGTIWNTGASVVNFLTGPAATAEELHEIFSVFLQSEEKALDFMERLTLYAAKTSFAMNEIAQSAKILLANTNMGAEEVVETIIRLGEFAAASKKPLGEIATLYAKATSVGVNNEVMESFATIGIPLKKTIAELRGISEKEVFDMASRRELGIEHLNAAIESLTGAGGKFNGLVERSGRTFNGLVSTLGDGVEILVQKFAEGLMPHLKAILQALIEATDKLTPIFKVLGKQIGDTFGAQSAEGLSKIIKKIVMEAPKIGIHLKYAIEKVAAAFQKIMALVEKFTDTEAPQWMKDKAWDMAGKQLERQGLTGKSGAKYNPVGLSMQWKLSREYLEKLKKEESEALETWRDAELQKIDEHNAAMLEEEKRIEENRRAAAKAADEEAAAAAAAAAEDKKRRDEQGRAIMIASEEATKAELARKKLIEENKRRLENYRDRRREWERKQKESIYEKQSVSKQERMLRKEAVQLGVEGGISPESIRARLDVLAEAGAKSNEREIAALERLLEKWDALTERKRAYVKTREETMTNLRADALEAAGKHQAAARLREEMETARRIEELKNQGFTARQAAEIANAESTVRRYKKVTEQIQNSRVEFIQGHQAAEGGGGVSLRVGGATLEQVKEQTRLQKEMKRMFTTLLNRKTTSSNVAVLA